MQKLLLKDFEFQISPNTWNIAQDLIQLGAVRSLQEVEKHFWVATVADAELEYEIEVMISPQRIKAFTCACWQPGRRMMCAHIAAALFKVRQFLDQKTQDRQARAEAEQREKTGRLTVENLMETISSNDLAEFVRGYARRDRDFAMALKTHFAADFADNENPYLLILDAVLPRHRGIRPLQAPEWRRLLKTLDDLEIQTARAKEGANAYRVFQIALAVISRATPLLAKSLEPRRERLVQHIRLAVQHLIDLPPEFLSPELRENRRSLLFDFLTRSDPPATGVEEIVLPFLAQQASDNTFFAEIQALFDQAAHPAPPVVLHLFLAALAQRKLPEATLRVLRDYTAWPARSKEAIAVLYRLHYWEAVLVAGEYLLENKLLNAGQRREVDDLLLAAAEKAGDRLRHTAYLRQRYRQYGHESLLQRLKSLAGPEWPIEAKKLLEELRLGGDGVKIAQILAAEGELDGLAAELKKMGDLDVLRQYEHLFGPDRLAFVREMYLDVLTTYLSNHFGKQASGHVQEQLAGLVRTGQSELAKEIVSGLTMRFPDRATLPGELAEVFPKPKKTPTYTMMNQT